MLYIDRDQDGAITGRFANAQFEGQEFLADDHPDLAAREMADALVEMRTERNRRLAATDFALLADNPGGLTATELDKVKAYRVALRDLPAGTADPTTPAWPALTATIQGKLGLGAE